MSAKLAVINANARARKAREELDAVRTQARRAKVELARQQAQEVGAYVGAITAGMLVSGQMSRIVSSSTGEPPRWIFWMQLGALVLGAVALRAAKKPWERAFGFFLIGLGSTAITDMSRKRDLIPGDWSWENVLPNNPRAVRVVTAE